MTPRAPVWRKSRYSQNSTECVEVQIDVREIGVRDTKDREGGELFVPPLAWLAVIAQLRA